MLAFSATPCNSHFHELSYIKIGVLIIKTDSSIEIGLLRQFNKHCQRHNGPEG